MTRHVVFSDPSLSDIEQAWDFLAERSQQAATRIVEGLIAYCLRLGEFPYAHPAQPGISGSEVRRAVYHGWVILYQVHEAHVEVVRVVYGGRDPARVLAPR